MMLGRENFDLITSGIHLSGSSGIELLKKIRENGDEKKSKTSFLIIRAEKEEVYSDQLKTLCASVFLIVGPGNNSEFALTVCNN